MPSPKPGLIRGSAPASDLLWHSVSRLAAEKPVVAYFDDVAASGGYYLACAASKIVAQPVTLTGSIGVVAGKLDLSGLFDKLGVHTEILTRGDAAGSPRLVAATGMARSMPG